MKKDVVPQDVKEEIWIRDEFSCKSCGRTLNWDELQIGYVSQGSDGEKIDTGDMRALCEDCAREGDLPTLADDQKKSIIAFIRDLYRDKMEAEDWDEECVDPAVLQKKIDDLKKENRGILGELDQKTAMAIAYKKKYDRESKDFENYRNRQKNDIGLKVRSGLKNIALGIIETIDNLDRAIEEMRKHPDNPAMKETAEGMETIRKGLMNTLSRHEVEEIDPQGDPFDPNIHEAVETVPDEKQYRDTVAHVHSKGYTISGSVIRPAKVSVTIGGPARSKPDKDRIECLEEFEICDEPEDDGAKVITSPPTHKEDENGEEIVVVSARKKKMTSN
ncbi:MAG: nucleotide exchange factor GrpE [Thermoplasmatota archaeon]